MGQQFKIAFLTGLALSIENISTMLMKTHLYCLIVVQY